MGSGFINSGFRMAAVSLILAFSVLLGVMDSTSGRATSRRFALLVGGGTTSRDNFDSFYENIRFVAGVLGKLGYPRSHVRILFYGGKTAAHPIVEAEATKEAVLAELHAFQQTVTPADSLLIFRSGHGSIALLFEKCDPLPVQGPLPQNGPGGCADTAAVMCFPDGDLTYLELQEKLAAIHAAQIVVILNQCYSGQFTDMATALDHTVVVSQTGEVGVGFFCNRRTDRGENTVWPFVKCLFEAFLMHDRGGKKQSLLNAYEYMHFCNPNVRGVPVHADRPLLKEEPQIKYGKNLKRGSVYIHTLPAP